MMAKKKDSLMDKDEKSNEANDSSHKNNNPEEESMRCTATVNRHSFSFATSDFITRDQTRCKGMERCNVVVILIYSASGWEYFAKISQKHLQKQRSVIMIM